MLETLDLARLRLVDAEALAPPPSRRRPARPSAAPRAVPAGDLPRVRARRGHRDHRPRAGDRAADAASRHAGRGSSPRRATASSRPAWRRASTTRCGCSAASGSSASSPPTTAGSAIVAQVTASVAPLTKLRPGRPAPAARTGNYAVAAVPLETLVEADDVHAAPTARMRVRAGPALRAPARRAQPRPVRRQPTAPRTRSRRRRRHPTPPAGASSRSSPAARSTARSSTRTSRRRCARRRRRCPPRPAIAAADAAAVLAAAQAWVAWADALVFTPSGGPAGVGAGPPRVRVRR